MVAIRTVLACVLLTLVACSDGAQPSAPVAAPQQMQSAEAESTIDGATIHVNAIQTSQLPESVVRQYGIAPAPTTVLLLVNVRGAGIGSAPTINASVTDLQGHSTAVALREVNVPQPGEPTMDYVGTVDISLPDTLRFAIRASRDGATTTVQLARDFYPQ